uniref:Ig-like domain-containing protein n=1 Tax=Callorhinchus milii TaxID=7868 RepID=A0A4W3H685_CALMI
MYIYVAVAIITLSGKRSTHSLYILPAHIIQRVCYTALNNQNGTGFDVYLQCNYTATTTSDPDLYWYRHYPNKAPEYILWTDKRNNPRHADFAKDRFITHVEEAERTVPLNISQVTVADSAVYYCALRPTEAQISDSARQKLLKTHRDSMHCNLCPKHDTVNVPLLLFVLQINSVQVLL